MFAQVRALLGLGPAMQQPQQRRVPSSPTAAGTPGLGRFLLPLSECEFALESAVDELLVSPLTAIAAHSLPLACILHPHCGTCAAIYRVEVGLKQRGFYVISARFRTPCLEEGFEPDWKIL